jgi:hypothetical protein
LVLGLIAGLMAVLPGAGAASTVGEFSEPFAPPAGLLGSEPNPPAVGIGVMPDGRIVYWGGLTGLENSNPGVTFDGGRAGKPSPSLVLDLRSGTPSWSAPVNPTGPTPNEDFFCGDIRLTPDGRIITVGGTIWRSDPVDVQALLSLLPPEAGGVVTTLLETAFGAPCCGGTAEVFGNNLTRWYDPGSNAWVGGDDNRMHESRWYPTLLTLPNGNMFVASGVHRLVYNSEGENVHRTETFDPSTNAWTANPDTADISLPLFARLHLTYDGKILYTGAGQMWSPFGQAASEALWNLQQVFDPATNTWSVTGVGNFGARSSVFTVPLMYSGDYSETKILVGGGTVGTSPSSYVATNLSEVITYKDGQTTNTRTGELNNRRWFSSGVLLPTGEVMAFSGGDKDEVIQPGSEQAVHQAELFDPATNTWTPMATGTQDRTYHNSAILLADGSVLVGGHSPINNGYGKPDNTTHDAGLTANNLKDASFEIYKPPYMFGDRPSILAAPTALAHGGTSAIAVDSAIDKVVLMHLPTTTHVTDADQRGVEVAVSQVGPAVTFTVPDANVVPPGYYYVFALSGGVPSEAKIVRVG